MSMFSGIKSLFSSPKIVGDGLSALSKGVDKAILTPEESNEMFLKFVEASAPMNVSRRIIACGVTVVWALGFIVGVVGILTDYKADEIFQLLSVYVMPPFLTIVSWYYWKGGKKASK